MKNKVTERFFAASLIFISLILVSATGVYNKSNGDYFMDYNSMISPKALSQTNQMNSETLAVPLDTLKKRVNQKMEALEEVPEEIEQVIEVALSERNAEMAAEILQSVEEALKEVKWVEIEETALREMEIEMTALNLDSIVDAAMVEAHAEMAEELATIREEGFQSVEESLAAREMALKNAEMGIEIAKHTLETMPMDSIVQMSIREAMKALSELDMEGIIREAMDSVKIELEMIEEESIK